MNREEKKANKQMNRESEKKNRERWIKQNRNKNKQMG